MSHEIKSSPYIALLKKTLSGCLSSGLREYAPLPLIVKRGQSFKYKCLILFCKLLTKKKLALCRHVDYNEQTFVDGRYAPPYYATSLIGLRRLDNIEYCFNEIIHHNIPGDFIETGVWRGGATIFMRALLKEAGITARCVYVADSFCGLPEPNEKKYPADKGSLFHKINMLNVSLETVKNNFKKYDLLDEQVVFVQGWFKDTLPSLAIQNIALLRLDGDMYESTMDALSALYHKVSMGGFIIIDDWCVPGSQKAVVDYRRLHAIQDEIMVINSHSVFWQKTR